MSQGRSAKLLTWVLKTVLRNAFVCPILKAQALHQHLSFGRCTAQTTAEIGSQGVSPIDSALSYILKS